MLSGTGIRWGALRGVSKLSFATAISDPYELTKRTQPRGAGFAAQNSVRARALSDVAADDPMMASVAGRYAAALLDLAKEQGKLGEVEKDLETFQAMLDGSADLKRMVLSPVFSAEEQSRAIGAVLVNGGITGLTSNFLKLLAKNRRLFSVSEMITAFRSILARERGEVTAEVTSAHPLSEQQAATLLETLKKSVAKNVKVVTKVDPTLLGGLIVKIGSRMIDSSLRTKLNALKVAMKGTG